MGSLRRQRFDHYADIWAFFLESMQARLRVAGRPRQNRQVPDCSGAMRSSSSRQASAMIMR